MGVNIMVLYFIYAFCQTLLVFSLKEAISIQNFAHKHPQLLYTRTKKRLKRIYAYIQKKNYFLKELVCRIPKANKFKVCWMTQQAGDLERARVAFHARISPAGMFLPHLVEEGHFLFHLSYWMKPTRHSVKLYALFEMP